MSTFPPTTPTSLAHRRPLERFLILTSYYLMKPVREVLILDQPGGAELKSYACSAQAVFLLVIVPLYGALAARLLRQRLIKVVTLFFIGCLPVFWWAVGHQAPVGFVFFLWTGIFSLLVIAQFWGYANDACSVEAGQRLFAVIAFGSSAGAVFGARSLAAESIALLVGAEARQCGEDRWPSRWWWCRRGHGWHAGPGTGRPAEDADVPPRPDARYPEGSFDEMEYAYPVTE